MEPAPDAARIAALEARVAALEAELARLAARPAPAVRVALPVGQGTVGRRLPAVSSEDVLSRAGIGLLLLGVAFGLRWAVEGLTEAARVGVVAGLGAVLVAGGLAFRTRRAFGSVLTGGGLAVLFGACFAAFQVYRVVPEPVGLVVAAGLAVATYALARRSEAPTLAVIALAGAFGAAALLFRNGGTWAGTFGLDPAATGPGSLVGALVFVLAATVAGAVLHARTGWRPVLAALAVGGSVALVVVRFKARALPGFEPFAVVGAAGLAWALVGGWPVFQPAPAVPTRRWTLAAPRALAVWLAPVVAFGLAASALRLGDVAAGALLAVGGALAFGLGRLTRDDEACEALTFAAFALVGAGVAVGLPDELAPGVAVAVAALAGVWGRHRRQTGLASAADVAVAVTALLHAGWLLWHAAGTVPAHSRSLGLLGTALALGALGGAVFGRVDLGRATRLYVLALHALVLLGVRYAAHPLPAREALTDGAWALYAVALVAAGLRRGRDDLRLLGLGTLALTLAKLLLLDLPNVATVWRVAIFVGLGALLLVVSYFAPSLLRGKGDGRAEKGEA